MANSRKCSITRIFDCFKNIKKPQIDPKDLMKKGAKLVASLGTKIFDEFHNPSFMTIMAAQDPAQLNPTIALLLACTSMTNGFPYNKLNNELNNLLFNRGPSDSIALTPTWPIQCPSAGLFEIKQEIPNLFQPNSRDFLRAQADIGNRQAQQIWDKQYGLVPFKR